MDPVQLLEDREAIAEVVRTYARAVDQRDFAAVEACFAPDLHVVDWWGQCDMDRDATMAYIEGVGIFRSTMHMMGNQVIHVEGDEATCLTRALLTHTSDGTAERHEHSPIYTERLARRDGRWVIVERGGEEVLDGPGVASATTTDDPGVRWLLDRAAVADRIAELGFTATPRFVGRVLIDPNEDRGSFTALPAEAPMPAEVEPHLVHWGDGEVTLPARPASADPRVQRLLDLSELRDRSTLHSPATAVTNNQRVTVDEAGATVVVTYAYLPPAWGLDAEVWLDRYDQGRFVDRQVVDNVMPDDRMRRT